MLWPWLCPWLVLFALRGGVYSRVEQERLYKAWCGKQRELLSAGSCTDCDCPPKTWALASLLQFFIWQKEIPKQNSCRKYLKALELLVSAVWDEQKGPPHLLPLPLCYARLGSSTVNRCDVENSQAPAYLQVVPGQSQNWASVSCWSSMLRKQFPRLNLWCLTPRAGEKILLMIWVLVVIRHTEMVHQKQRAWALLKLDGKILE